MTRNIYSRLAFSIMLATPILCAAAMVAAAPATDVSTTEAPAQKVIQQIKNEIQEARKLQTRPRLKIDQVDVTLRTVAKKEGDLGVRLVVPVVSLSAGAGLKHTLTHTIEFSFEPEGALDVASTPSLGLAEAIKQAKLAIQQAAATEPKFKLNQFVFESEFVLVQSATGGLSFWLIDVGNAQISQSEIQRISIKMSILKE